MPCFLQYVTVYATAVIHLDFQFQIDGGVAFNLLESVGQFQRRFVGITDPAVVQHDELWARQFDKALSVNGVPVT
jgi:hypothetical protein